MAGSNNITKDVLEKFVNEIANDEDYGIDNYGYNATCVGDFVETVKLFNKVNGITYRTAKLLQWN